MGDPVMAFLADVARELDKSRRKYPKPLNSPHEAFAVILEEVDEYWQEVKHKQDSHDFPAMYSELVQIAAMATRAAVETVMKPLEVSA